MCSVCRKIYFSLLFLVTIAPLRGIAQLSVTSDREDSSYEIGETVLFSVEGASQAVVEYVLFFDRFTEPLIHGSINLDADGKGTIPFSLDEPGVVFCEVEADSAKALEAVQFSFDQIIPFEEEPDDWDEFWASQVALLADLPMDPVLELVEDTEYTTTYEINLANIDNRRVYGYVSVPKSEGPFPAIFTFPSFGDAPGLTDPQWAIAERGGALSFSVGIHNVPPDETDENAYAPDDISTPEGYYYRYAILGAIRMIDYVFTRPDFDGQHVGVTGISQGGGLSILVAGIDDRVNLLATSKNVLGEHAAHKYGRASGFPNYLRRSRIVYGTLEHEVATLSASKYYDAVYAARRFDGPVFMAVGYHDIISPAATSMACFNQFSGPKILFHEVNINHALNTEQYINGRYAFFRRYFSSMQSPPWPWPETTLSYGIEAGEYDTVQVAEALLLQGNIELEQVSNSASFQPKWTLLDGPGSAVFSEEHAFSTEVQFSEPGIYTLQFSGKDMELIPTLERYYSFADQVKVVVEGSPSTSVEDFSAMNLVQVVPNPASNYLEIRGLERLFTDDLQVEFMDVTGQVLQTDSVLSSSNLRVDLSGLSKGVYFVRLSAQRSDQRVIKKIILQ